MSKDKIKIRILADGRIVSMTDKISMRNHKEAEDILSALTELLGGEEIRESTKSQDKHFHRHHEGGHSHEH